MMTPTNGTSIGANGISKASEPSKAPNEASEPSKASEPKAPTVGREAVRTLYRGTFSVRERENAAPGKREGTLRALTERRAVQHADGILRAELAAELDGILTDENEAYRAKVRAARARRF
jgi:hypothetical protein